MALRQHAQPAAVEKVRRDRSFRRRLQYEIQIVAEK
jgi:hypothetical protein